MINDHTPSASNNASQLSRVVIWYYLSSGMVVEDSARDSLSVNHTMRAGHAAANGGAGAGGIKLLKLLAYDCPTLPLPRRRSSYPALPREASGRRRG